MRGFEPGFWLDKLYDERDSFAAFNTLSEEPAILMPIMGSLLARYNGDPESVEHLHLDAAPRPSQRATEEEDAGVDGAALASMDLCSDEGRADFQDRLSKVFSTYRRQTLVVVVTYLELIIEDFLQVAFSHNPNAMYEYLSHLAEQRGKVDLRDVLEAPSKEILLETLALRSARLVGQRRFDDAAKTITRVTGRRIGMELIRQLDSLIGRRNRLVHESMEVEVSAEEADNALVAVMNFVWELGILPEVEEVQPSAEASSTEMVL